MGLEMHASVTNSCSRSYRLSASRLNSMGFSTSPLNFQSPLVLSDHRRRGVDVDAIMLLQGGELRPRARNRIDRSTSVGKRIHRRPALSRGCNIALTHAPGKRPNTRTGYCDHRGGSTKPDEKPTAVDSFYRGVMR